VSAFTRAIRSAGPSSVMSMTSSAPMARAISSRNAGAPTTITWPAPWSCASAVAFNPTGPLPWITTLSPSLISARSMACTEVGNPQPAAMKRWGGRFAGRRNVLTPGFR